MGGQMPPSPRTCWKLFPPCSNNEAWYHHAWTILTTFLALLSSHLQRDGKFREKNFQIFQFKYHIPSSFVPIQFIYFFLLYIHIFINTITHQTSRCSVQKIVDRRKRNRKFPIVFLFLEKISLPSLLHPRRKRTVRVDSITVLQYNFLWSFPLRPSTRHYTTVHYNVWRAWVTRTSYAYRAQLPTYLDRRNVRVTEDKNSPF